MNEIHQYVVEIHMFTLLGNYVENTHLTVH